SPRSSPGERWPRLSSQSYEYGASRTWHTHGHTSAGGASTLIPRHSCSTGDGTSSSQGYGRATSSSDTPQRSPITPSDARPDGAPPPAVALDLVAVVESPHDRHVDGSRRRAPRAGPHRGRAHEPR